MSTPTRPDAASISAIRGLLERNLLTRAVALSETRWPGSGPVVELAHEWVVLSPSARRERLASIGPEELGRLRGVAQLQPDLARVLDDLEARGIIPPEQIYDGGAGMAPVDDQPAALNESIADAIVDYSEQGLQNLAGSVQEDLPPQLEASASLVTAETAAAVAAEAAEIARSRAARAAMEPVPMPDLDLGLPSTGEFLAEESHRRDEANRLANSILDRARARVDDAASRLTQTPVPVVVVSEGESAVAARELLEPAALSSEPQPTESSAVTPPVTQQESTRVDSPSDMSLAKRIETARVLSIEPHELMPTTADLQAIAQATGRTYVTLRPSEMSSREFFGGLVRDGRQIQPEAGAFPRAASQPSMIVVSGRLYPKTIQRLRDGYCDIPGTQATVRVHPECRIVLLSE